MGVIVELTHPVGIKSSCSPWPCSLKAIWPSYPPVSMTDGRNTAKTISSSGKMNSAKKEKKEMVIIAEVKGLYGFTFSK